MQQIWTPGLGCSEGIPDYICVIFLLSLEEQKSVEIHRATHRIKDQVKVLEEDNPGSNSVAHPLMCSFTQAPEIQSSCSFSTQCFPSIMEKGKLWLRRTLLTISTVLDEVNHSNTWVKEFRKLKSRTGTSMCQTHKFLSIQKGGVYPAPICDYLLEIQNGFGTSITPEIKGCCVHQTLLSALTAKNPSKTGKEFFFGKFKIQKPNEMAKCEEVTESHNGLGWKGI